VTWLSVDIFAELQRHRAEVQSDSEDAATSEDALLQDSNAVLQHSNAVLQHSNAVLRHGDAEMEDEGALDAAMRRHDDTHSTRATDGGLEEEGSKERHKSARRSVTGQVWRGSWGGEVTNKVRRVSNHSAALRKLAIGDASSTPSTMLFPHSQWLRVDITKRTGGGVTAKSAAGPTAASSVVTAASAAVTRAGAGGFLPNVVLGDVNEGLSQSHHWYSSPQDVTVGVPKTKGGGLHIQGAKGHGVSTFGDPAIGFGDYEMLFDKNDVYARNSITGPYTLPNGKIVDEDGALVDLALGRKHVGNGTILEFAPKIDVHDKGAYMADAPWLKEGWTVDEGEYDMAEADREMEEELEWCENVRPTTLSTDVRDLLLRLRTSVPRANDTQTHVDTGSEGDAHMHSSKKARLHEESGGDGGGGSGEGDGDSVGVCVLSEKTLAERQENLMLHLKASLMSQLRPQWLPHDSLSAYQHALGASCDSPITPPTLLNTNGNTSNHGNTIVETIVQSNKMKEDGGMCVGGGGRGEEVIEAGVHVISDECVGVCEAIGRAGREGVVLRVGNGTHRWLGKLKFTNGETKWINNHNLERDDMYNGGSLHVRGEGRGDAAVRGVCEGAALWGEWKVYFGTKGSFENVCLFLETDNCYNPTLQLQGGNWTVTNCEVRAVRSVAIMARDQSKLKIKECLIGGFDRSWYLATGGIVVKGRADVRMKGGRIEMLEEGFGMGVSVQNSAQLILHQVLVHHAAIGVDMGGEARVRITKCILRDLEIAALNAGHDSGASLEVWLADNVCYGPAPLWAGNLRPARLVGESEWYPVAPEAHESLMKKNNGWVDRHLSLKFPPEMGPYRIGNEQPLNADECAYVEQEEGRQLRRSEHLFEKYGEDWKNIADHDVSVKVRQRLLWRERREMDRQSLEAIAEDRPDPFPHFAQQRGACWCEDCAAPEHLLPPQPNNGEAFVDPRTGCWAVPFLVDSTWEDLLHENEQVVADEKAQCIMNQLDPDSVNVTHFAESLAAYWATDLPQVHQHLNSVVRGYLASRPNKTWAQGERRLKKEIIRAHLMKYQSEVRDPEAKLSYQSMMERPINQQTGQRIFNLDYGESSDEDYDGMRYAVLPMGVGWHAWNYTLFENIAENKTLAYDGVMAVEDLLPSHKDRSYSMPDPCNPGPSQLMGEGIQNTPFGADTEYHLECANKHEPVEHAVSVPGSFPVRWQEGHEQQMPTHQRMHFDELQKHNIMHAGMGKGVLQELEAWENGNSSRPGMFDLTFASPIIGDRHASVMPVIEGGERNNQILSDARGAVPVLNEQQYLWHLWQETRRQRALKGTSAKYVAMPGKPKEEYLDQDFVAVSANHPPPLVRKGLTLKWDLATWVNSCLHGGGGWNGSALPLDYTKWPRHSDEVTWQGAAPRSKRLRGDSDSSSTDHDSGEGNISEEDWDARVMPEGSSDELPSDMQTEEKKTRKLAERRHREARNKNTRIFQYVEQRSPECTPLGESETVLITVREPTRKHPDYYKNQTMDEFLGTYPVPNRQWVPPVKNV